MNDYDQELIIVFSVLSFEVIYLKVEQ